jgi:hypothetical protein
MKRTIWYGEHELEYKNTYYYEEAPAMGAWWTRRGYTVAFTHEGDKSHLYAGR